MKFFSYICNCVALDTGMCACLYKGEIKQYFEKKQVTLRFA